MNVNKQQYKYYRNTECSHFIHSIINGTYNDEIKNRDESELSSDAIEDTGLTDDPMAVYFGKIGQAVEHAFELNYIASYPKLKAQLSFNIEGQTLRPDLIEINEEKKTIMLVEIKSTTNKKWFTTKGEITSGKKKHVFDLEFQYHMFKRAYPDYKVGAYVGVINTDGWPTDKFAFMDLTNHMCAKATFDAYCIEIENIISQGLNSVNEDASKSKCLYGPECGQCSDSSAKVYDNYDYNKVSDLLSQYPDKLAMIDFETINDPLPKDEWYKPYDKVVVQLSTHLMENGKVVKHEEHLSDSTSKENLTIIYDMLVKYKNDGYKMVAYYKSFEKSCFNTMSDILGRDELRDYELLDLFDFFKKTSKANKAAISFVDWGASASIKKTIMYAYDVNPYSDGSLPINNGGAAMAELYRMVIDQEKDVNKKDLLAYCKQDTLTMVDLYNKIVDTHNRQNKLK